MLDDYVDIYRKPFAGPFDMDSFGNYCPKNWQEIADSLNEIVCESDIYNDYGYLTNKGEEIVYAVWEKFCDGEMEGVVPNPIW